MRDERETTRPRSRETQEELAEAAEHRSKAEEHRREAAGDRAEAAADRRQGHPVGAAGNEVEVKGHEIMAEGHRRAAVHDEREAARESRASGRPAGPIPATAERESRTARPEPRTDDSAAAAEAVGSTATGHSFFGDEALRRFRSRWDDIQAAFIDEPRNSVAEADALVREATDALQARFDRDRRQLEGIWARGEDASTEDLRVTLQRYRSFFERLLTI